MAQAIYFSVGMTIATFLGILGAFWTLKALKWLPQMPQVQRTEAPATYPTPKLENSKKLKVVVRSDEVLAREEQARSGDLA